MNKSPDKMPPALLALAAAAFAIGTSEFVIMGLLPDVAADLSVSIPKAGLLVTGYALGVVIGAPILAVVTATLPRRGTLIGLAVLFTIGNLLCALAPDYMSLMGARVITALSHGTFFGIGSVVAAGLVAPNQRSQAIALMFTGLTLANVLGVPLGRMIGHQFGWRMTFWAVVVLTLIALAALMRLLPRRMEEQKGSIVREFAALGDARVLFALVTSALSSASLFCVFTYITPTLIEVTGLPQSAVAPVLLLFGVGLTVGSTIGGRLGDRYLVASLLAVLALNPLVLMIIHSVDTVPFAMVSMLFVWGAFAFALVPLLQTLIVRHAQAAPNLASTLNQGAFNLGNAVGAWIGSLMLSTGMALEDLSWASAALSIAALLLAGCSSLLPDRAANSAEARAT